MSHLRLSLLVALIGPGLALAACKKTDADAAPPVAAAGPIAPAPAGGWAAQVARTAEGGYRMGNPDAPVKLVEFGSRTCPHCAAFAAEGLPELEKSYVASGRVSYEFRDFAIHAPDLAAILLGRCVAPAAFFPTLKQMFADLPAVDAKLTAIPSTFQSQLEGKSPAQQAAIWANYLGYTAFVGQRGVPAGKAQACLANGGAIDTFAADMQRDTQRYNLNATPTFVVNGTVSEAREYPALKPVLDAALAG